MEEIKTEEQMKEIQEAITYYHELLERNEMLEKRNQAMLKKIRQEKRDKLKSELCCKVYAIIAVEMCIRDRDYTCKSGNAAYDAYMVKRNPFIWSYV